jgi:glycerate kinase
MRILVAPDRFAGSLTAAEAGEAIAAGWSRTAPRDELDLLPLADGGPGFLDVLHAGRGGAVEVVTVRGPLGDPVPARVLVEGTTAYVEAAEAVGLHLVTPSPHGAAAATSAGVGDLVAAAAESGARRVVVGVGGTATTDGGRGLVDALGGLDPARGRLAGVELVAATATDAPLLGPSGAAHGFATAKGADRATRDALEAALREWATATDGGLAVRAGTGAGGGIGFGLMLLGARRVNGTELVAGSVGLAARAGAADLAVTGTAVFDWEVLRGRVVVAVARAAQAAGRPTVVLAERVDVGRRELSSAGIDAAYAAGDAPSSDEAHTPYARLAALAGRAARTWSH